MHAPLKDKILRTMNIKISSCLSQITVIRIVHFKVDTRFNLENYSSSKSYLFIEIGH